MTQETTKSWFNENKGILGIVATLSLTVSTFVYETKRDVTVHNERIQQNKRAIDDIKENLRYSTDRLEHRLEGMDAKIDAILQTMTKRR